MTTRSNSHSVNKRKHSKSGLDFAEPTNPYYGSHMDIEQVQAPDLAPGAVLPGAIAVGAVTETSFADSIRPVQLVDSLPTLPDPEYPAGAIIYHKGEGKLYRNVDGLGWISAVPAVDGGIERVNALPSPLPLAAYPVGTVVFYSGKLYRNVSTDGVQAWTAATPAEDIVGQIVGTQIKDGAVTTEKVFANAIKAAQIDANAITADKILAGEITGSKLAMDTITSREIHADAITSSELAANAAVFGKVAAGAIRAEQIVAGAIRADHLKIGAAGGEMFLTNPGFEDGSTGGWYLWNPGEYGDNFLAVERVATAGSKVGTGEWQAYVRRGDNGTPAAVSECFIPVKPGQRVSLSALVSGGVRFEIMWAAPDKSYLSGSWEAHANPEGTRWTIFADAPAGAGWAGFMIWNNQTTAGPTWTCFDDVRVAVGDLALTGASNNILMDQDGLHVYGGALEVKNPAGTTTITGGEIAASTIKGTHIVGQSISVSHLQGDFAHNLLADPGFEDGGAWSEERSQETPRSGVWNGRSNGGYIIQYFPVMPNRKYMARMRMRGNSGNGANDPMGLRARWFDKAWNQIGNDVTVAYSGGWGQNNSYGDFGGYVDSPSTAYFCGFFAFYDETAWPAWYYTDDGEFYLVDDDSIKAGGSVLIQESGVTIYNGKLVVYPDGGGTPAIIDGLSNMFKIAASSTQTKAFRNGVGLEDYITATLSGLAPSGVCPVVQTVVQHTGSFGRGEGYLCSYLSNGTAIYWEIYTQFDANGNDLRITLDNHNGQSNEYGASAVQRYYVMKEVAL